MVQEKVNECCKHILDLSTRPGNSNPNKRKLGTVPRSPNGVIDAALISSDRSNDSWALSSVSSEPPFKKSRSQEQGMLLPSLNRVIVGSPS